MDTTTPTAPARTLPPPPPPAAPPTDPATSPPPRPRRPPVVSGVLWWAFGIVLVVAGLAWGTFSVVTLLAHEERVENETFAADDVRSLSVDDANGRVTIIATETTEIRVRAEISEGLRGTGESREIVDGTLRLRATCPSIGSNFCWVNYEITVPRDLPIEVRAGNGTIQVGGSDAAISLNGDNGSLVLENLSGPLDISTDNGRVEATALRSTEVVADSDNGSVVLEFLVAPTSVRATTDNGRVEVVVPDDGTAYQADLHTGNGGEELLVPTDPASTNVLVLHTDNGSVSARTA